MSEYQQDLIWSEKVLNEVVWPAIKASFKAKMISVEGDKSNVSRELDMSSGIDAYIKSEQGIQSLASRVQRCDASRPWNTFTIRSARDIGGKTEIHKRVSSIKNNDSIYPMLTMQAYVSEIDFSFASAAIVRTEHLYAYLMEERENIMTRQTSNATFKVIKWSILLRWLEQRNIHSSMRVFLPQMELNERAA